MATGLTFEEFVDLRLKPSAGADRQLIEAFVQRIEFDPDKGRGVIYLYADLESAFASTRVVGGLRRRVACNHGPTPARNAC